MKRKRKLRETDRVGERSGFGPVVGKIGVTSGIAMKPMIEMLVEDSAEAHLSKEGRVLSINGNHPMFRLAESMDEQIQSEAGKLKSTGPNTTMPILKAAALAWADSNPPGNRDLRRPV
jgi:hypothetical protein